MGPCCGACQAASAGWAAETALNAAPLNSAFHSSLVFSKPIFPGRVSWTSNTSSFPIATVLDIVMALCSRRQSALVTGKGEGLSQLQTRAMSLCCDPGEGKVLCQEHSWHLIWHPPLVCLVSEHLQHNSIQFMLKRTSQMKNILVFSRGLSVLKPFSSTCGFLAPKLCMC